MSGLNTSLAASSQALSQFSFSFFIRLPAELQLEILSHCQQNDLICLSLSSHSLRALTLPLIPAKPWLLSYDQIHPSDAIQCKCGDDSMTGVGQNNYSHRRKRHIYEYSNKTTPHGPPGCTDWSPCRPYPADHAVYMAALRPAGSQIITGWRGKANHMAIAGGEDGEPALLIAGVIRKGTRRQI
ncbi:F-box domain-containing protein [Diaporthe amygdali]|uniref:F-box domain-containing protein n=1 Tax=Phomopsis amygdali TaxID=1214568 RepID=UPI0022FE593B|nr:F-box domain-containing protein [Diaporthe amygdali]KAJ0123741.1 F-box domain-containing protein [Diaporthe amygdali]